MRGSADQFAWSSRVLHWSMAAAVLAMLFIGAAMVASLTDYHALVSIHRPLGIVILALVMVRFVNRQLKPPPPFPATMSPLERRVATWSERTMYALMFFLPLIGWGMLSAARYPIVLCGPVHLPPILPHSVRLYAVLRKSHTVLAYLLFFAFVGHLSAVLFHTLVLRDGLLRRMAPWRMGARAAADASRPTAPPTPGGSAR
jgi:cytochrome b561